ncbi:hypothetical protein F5984_09565 [Rudanella paleaurantiibacter]|uniref:Uncharacterized protein n=1 Tax=Rudanella paleaurantiibacter TaxID=2614655 RepID=A0A7J5U082_9BACT|nr:hypothetical protein [Rudanella paleaurantiibacter]KAB7731055.1 hypothetical protein F5984_09565 [Rudanella paleaurantiibacter]
MGELTRTQLSEMAQVWREMARNLSVYQASHWTELSTVQHYDLNAYQNSLLTRAQEIDERTYLLLNESLETILNRSIQLVDQAAHALHTTDEQAKALNMGALTVALAAGLYRNNVSSVQLALSELTNLTRPVSVRR